MRKRRLDENIHPFDHYPFEVFWWDSWQPVERLRIKNGVITTHVVDNEKVVEEIIPLSHLRIRSRKATMSDCSCILRPGLDVCVLSDCSDMEADDEDKKLTPVWIDARIRSIERKPHETKCECIFYISSYQSQGPIGASKRILNKEHIMVEIDKVSVLQRLEIPCEDHYFRWSTSEDCSSRQYVKLYTGKFCSDLSWLLVASVLKRAVFDVKSIQNQIVYELPDLECKTNQESSSTCSYSLNFKVDNGVLTPNVIQFVPDNRLEINPSEDMQTDGTLCEYNVPELRRSKRRNIKPQRFLACDLTEDDVDMTRLGGGFIYKIDYDEMPFALSIQADHEFRKDDNENEDPTYTYNPSSASGSRSNGKVKKDPNESQLAMVPLSLASEGTAFFKEQEEAEAPENLSETIGKMIMQYGSSSSNAYRRPAFGKRGRPPAYSYHSKRFAGGMLYRGPGGIKRKYKQRDLSKKGTRRGEAYGTRSEWESIYDMKPSASGRKSLSAHTCRELIVRCMQSIDAAMNKDEPPILDQWKEFQSANLPKDNDSNKESTDNVKPEEQPSEEDLLWKEMELALASLYFLDDSEELDSYSNVREFSRDKSKKVCNHDYRLNEQIGIICRLCGFVSTEMKDVSPPFWSNPSSTHREQKGEEESEDKQNKDGALNQFNIPSSCNAPSAAEGEHNVWTLIPELGSKLRIHQRKAFEFLWRNIAGGLVPARMQRKKKRRGGCVISHTPGAGKTLLIISFLVSYLKLFPGSRPLVLAPKTTLYTWYKEIIKWKIPIPVYQIHGGQTYKGEILRQRLKSSPNLPRNQDVMHVLDCLEKMQKWLSHPSVLLMGYTSFLTLTREDSNYAHRKYMAQVLKQCPGILILDEGHNPRSTKSRLRKALMRVDTGLRVLLSGTLFQNNFGEYFNTLLLARPRFVSEVLKKLDPKYKRKAKTRFSLENRARKLFIEKISKTINSNINEERMEGLNLLKSLTGKFIDNYEGGSADNLPGLQCYTLMMKSTSRQQEILDKLQNQRPAYKGFPLELELLITLGAIHPWLIRTTQCSNQYFTPDELENLSRTKFDVKFGSKVRFVMSLIPKCVMRKEKVLIFCHNIAPINMFLELFASIFRWRKGIEVLVLQGDIELFERGRVMDKFEEPGGPSKIMLASITACAEGISLTAASRVILLDSEWNPSKSKQAIARAFRPGQDKIVYVYQLLATGTLEEEKYSRTTWKEWVSSMIFSEELLEDPSHWQAPNIEDELLREIVEDDRGTLFHKIMKIDKASSVIRGKEQEQEQEQEQSDMPVQ